MITIASTKMHQTRCCTLTADIALTNRIEFATYHLCSQDLHLAVHCIQNLIHVEPDISLLSVLGVVS
jgi:hypothetical protein